MSKPQVPRVKLNSGHSIPQVGLGTWLSAPNEVAAAVRLSLQLGYTHIDCAVVYENQREIGEVLGEWLREKKNQRLEWENDYTVSFGPDDSEQAIAAQVQNMLEELQLDYLDLCLLHWPMGYDEDHGRWPRDESGKVMYSTVDWMDTYRALEQAVDEGKIKSIGVCNFNSIQMQRLVKEARIKPAMLQVEVHPYLPQHALLQWCAQQDIAVTGYSPLANPTHRDRKEGMPMLLAEPVLRQIGQQHNKSSAQIVLRWHMQRGVVIIPKSTISSELQQNIDVFDFVLTEAQMQQIGALDCGFRLNSKENRLQLDADHPHFPFGVEGAEF